MNKTTQNGFTLYELLMTTLVLGVVLAIGVPNMMDLTRNSRVTAAANDMHASFYMARSEAARSKSNITICGSANSTDADANCGGTFADGWIVFQDTNGDINRDNDEPVLRSHPAMPAQLSISMPGMDSYFSFAPTGLGRGNVTGVPAVSTAVICDERGNQVAAGGSSAARVLVITPLGRATVIRDVDMIGTLIESTGATCP
jgi:type IV fimbrial biogenesis protein FimT